MFIKRCSFLSVFQFKIRSSQSEVVFCVNVLFCVYLLSLNNNTHVVSVAFTAVCVCVCAARSVALIVSSAKKCVSNATFRNVRARLKGCEIISLFVLYLVKNITLAQQRV